MAGYTYFSIGTSGRLQGRVYWESQSNGVSANSSSVYARVEVARTDAYGPTYGTWTGDVNINGTSQGFSQYAEVNDGWVSLKDMRINVGHNSDGTKQCYIGATVHGPSGTSMEGITVSGGITATLDTIPRASEIGTFSGTDVTGNFSVTYTAKSSSFTHKLRIVTGSTTLKTISNYGSGTSFSFTTSELTTLGNLMTATNTVNLTAYLDTYNGSTKIGDSSKTNSCTWRRARIKLGGAWKKAIPYIKINGAWHQAIPFVKVNGSWKKGA